MGSCLNVLAFFNLRVFMQGGTSARGVSNIKIERHPAAQFDYPFPGTCVLLASEDMITQRIDAHLARAKRATVSVGKYLGDGRSETPPEKSLPNIRRERGLQLIRGKVQHKTKMAPVEVHLFSLLCRQVRL